MFDKIKKTVHDITAFGYALPTDTNVKENDNSKKVEEQLHKELGWPGMILFGSKSTGHDVAKKKKLAYVSNSNIFMNGGYKVWYGDFLSHDEPMGKLKKVSKELGATFYILREHDGRFLSQPPDDKYLEERYIIKISGDEVTINQTR